MREIKFRVINGNVICAYEQLTKHGWTCQLLNNSITYDGIFYDAEFGHYSSLIRNQFTGAKDQAGKEIYEGDIIMLEYHAGLPSTEGIELVKILRVEYFSNHTHYSAISKDGGSYSVNFGGSAVKSFLVIGNIYENPELL